METQKFDQWCVLEIMGHQRYAGRVTEQTVGGAAFVRVDVPEVDGLPAFSKLFGAGSIYSISPVSEEIARALIKRLRQAPLDVYALPHDLRAKLQPLPLEHTAVDHDFSDDDF